MEATEKGYAVQCPPRNGAKSVADAMAAYGAVHHRTISSMTRLAMDVARNSDYGIGYLMASNSFICGARTKLVQHAIDMGYDYLFFIDADVDFPVNALRKLMHTAEKHNERAVAGLYCMRNHPHFPLIYMEEDNAPGHCFPVLVHPEQHGKLIRCDATGFGCTLLRLDMFKDISREWFSLEGGGTEDIYFFCKAKRELGLSVVVDTAINCGHVGQEILVVPNRACRADSEEPGVRYLFSDEYCREHFEVEDNQCSEGVIQTA